MAFTHRANIAQLTFQAAGRDLAVSEFTARERLSAPFEIDVHLAAEDEIGLEDMVGRPACLTAALGDSERRFHGIVRTFRQTGASGRFFLYQARVVPALWMLALERDCRIFQDQTTEQIVREVLTESGITADQFAFRLHSRGYRPRTYCVQYRETDLNFVSRLLEEEGIFYFFEHERNTHRLVFGDGPVNYRPIPGEAKLLFNPTAAMVAEEEAVYAMALSQRLLPGKVTLRDFNFEKPSLDLTAAETAAKERERELYDYPGIFEDEGAGQRLAQIRLQQAVAFREQAEGESYCPRLAPGFTFTLHGHELERFNREFVVTEVVHTGAQPQVLEELGGGSGSRYANRFVAIPAAVAFRPEPMAAKPLVDGVQTAIVTGPAGEEIYTDAHGRVKVQFHWDRRGGRDEKSSCWIRVSHAWAGAGWGAIYLPRIGQEVVVDFLEGDPDRPIIVGRVYHGENRPPYELPAEKTKSTLKSDSTPGGGGSNELRFEDAKGAEEIYLHGQKDWTIAIENDKRQTIGRDESLTVARNRSKTVGADQSETVGANKTITVGVNHTETIGANMSLKVDGSKTEMVAINSAETIGLAKELSIGALYQVSVGGAMNETVGGAKMEEVGAYRVITVGLDQKETIGRSMSVTVKGDLSETVGKTHSLKAKKVFIEAEDEIVIRSGRARIVMQKNGDITVEGKAIRGTASGNLTLKGKKILEN
jgi:type VI secretion system secreted protein VgrG